MTEETNSLPEFDTWLANLRDTREVDEIVEIADVDSDDLVEMLRYHLFRVYKNEVVL